VYLHPNGYWHHPQLPYKQVGYREQSSDHIFESGDFISPHVVEIENIGEI
jgi:hypothetical protein